MTQDETLPLAREFDLIARHFRPLAGPGARDLRDDVAVFVPPPGRELVITVDAMVAGVHFLPDDPPETVGRKLLRVNLSDIAAKGAVPLGYLMTVSAPRSTQEAWFAGFAAGLALDQRAGRGPGTVSGSPARSATGRWAWRLPKAGSTTRPASCWPAIGCRSPGWD